LRIGKCPSLSYPPAGASVGRGGGKPNEGTRTGVYVISGTTTGGGTTGKEGERLVNLLRSVNGGRINNLRKRNRLWEKKLGKRSGTGKCQEEVVKSQRLCKREEKRKQRKLLKA